MSPRDGTTGSDTTAKLRRVAMRWRSRFFAGALLFFAVAGCRGGKPATPQRPELGAAVVPVEAADLNAERLADMLSIHAYARWPAGRFPRGFRVEALPEAARHLRDDKGIFALSRRRRAIAKLAAYGLERAEVQDALRTLDADPSYIRQHLAVYLLLQQRGVLSTHEIETIVYDLDRFAELAVAGCPTQKLEVYVPDDQQPEAFGLARITVGKDVSAVARALDPQSWDVCSKFFSPPERTYLATFDTSHQPVAEPPVPPGTPYGGVLGKRDLFEHYTCAVSPCDAWFKNMLLVTTSWLPPNTPGSRKYNVTYSLDEWLAGEVSGVSSEVKTDDGGATVSESSTGPVTVAAWKTVAFKNPVLTGASKAILQVTVDEQAGELAELACCPIPAPLGPPTLTGITPVP